MEGINNFYDKVFGKDSALFIGTLWLGMIAKHMDDVRKAEDDAYEFMGEAIFKWLNKLRTLYDNVEFKTDIPKYDKEIEFDNWLYNPTLNKYELKTVKIKKKDKFIIWFEQIKPTIFEYAKLDYKNHWNLYETSNQENYKLFKEYGFEGVPSFLIKTNDNREIKITGANLNKLSCELNEMTTKGCPTYQADMCIKESWFIN